MVKIIQSCWKILFAILLIEFRDGSDNNNIPLTLSSRIMMGVFL